MQIYLDAENHVEPSNSLTLNLSTACAWHWAGPRVRSGPACVGLPVEFSVCWALRSSCLGLYPGSTVSSLETVSRLLGLLVFPFPYSEAKDWTASLSQEEWSNVRIKGDSPGVAQCLRRASAQEMLLGLSCPEPWPVGCNQRLTWGHQGVGPWVQFPMHSPEMGGMEWRVLAITGEKSGREGSLRERVLFLPEELRYSL